MFITLLVFLFITASQAQDVCDQPIVVNANQDIATQFQNHPTIEKIDALSPKVLARSYQEKRRAMQVGSVTTFDFYFHQAPFPDKQGKELTKKAKEQAEYFIKGSLQNNNGLEVQYDPSHVICKSTEFEITLFASKSARSVECVARICLKAVEYNQAGSDKKARGVSSVSKKQ